MIFQTFRQWKATTEYHRTKDITHVQTMLGHKGLNNTLLYINLEHALFGEGDSQEFHVKVASNVEEACELVKAGFEPVCRLDGKQLFRKRK